MKKHLYLLFVVVLISFTKSFSQAGIYVRFNGIAIMRPPGAPHPGEFLVTSFETTDSTTINTNGPGGAGAGRANFGAIKLQKLLDPQTNPMIMRDFALGNHVTTASITWYNSSDVAYYQINLTDVLFQSVSILSPSCSGANCNNLYEEIHLSYAQIQWKDPVSNTSFSWDLRRNAAL